MLRRWSLLIKYNKIYGCRLPPNSHVNIISCSNHLVSSVLMCDVFNVRFIYITNEIPVLQSRFTCHTLRRNLKYKTEICTNDDGSVEYLQWVRAPVGSNQWLYKIHICCFSAKHEALRRKRKDRLSRNQDNVSEWSDISTRGLLF
jgi:hypothetical protein